METPLYFISDVHLMLNTSPEEESKQKKLFSFLTHISNTGGTLFIVGDFFEFYFEYPHVIPKVYFSVFSKLHTLKESGVDIHFLVGNHDYWVQEFITSTLTTKTYLGETTITINGKTFYLTHGDGLLTWDRGYRALKSVIRNRVFIWLYRWLHPTLGYKIADWVSHRGQHYIHTDEYNQKVVKELKVFAETITNEGADFVICGHYHQMVNEPVNGGRLIVLGDWIQYFSYGVFDGKTMELKRWEFDA